MGIYKAASRGIDKNDALLGLSERIIVDNVLGAVHEGAMQADNVGYGKELVESVNI